VRRSSVIFNAVLAVTVGVSAYTLYYIFFVTPTAQIEAGGVAQKIFYLHVPAILRGFFGSIVVCGIASGAYLARATDQRNALAQAGAECAVVFGLVMLTTGPFWAKKAWGVYWTWDPQLTSAFLTFMIYFAVVVLRRFAGDGESERRFAAALGLFGVFTLPIVHYSVQKWGGNHPLVMRPGGQGLGHPAMRVALQLGYVTMTLMTVVLLWLRTDYNALRARLRHVEERAAIDGRLDD
jgi:heme exporter protein C